MKTHVLPAAGMQEVCCSKEIRSWSEINKTTSVPTTAITDFPPLVAHLTVFEICV